MNTKVSAEFHPCNCGVIPQAHHHIDENTVIPWGEFVRAWGVYKEKLKDLQTKGEDLLVDRLNKGEKKDG